MAEHLKVFADKLDWCLRWGKRSYNDYPAIDAQRELIRFVSATCQSINDKHKSKYVEGWETPALGVACCAVTSFGIEAICAVKWRSQSPTGPWDVCNKLRIATIRRAHKPTKGQAGIITRHFVVEQLSKLHLVCCDIARTQPAVQPAGQLALALTH